MKDNVILVDVRTPDMEESAMMTPEQAGERFPLLREFFLANRARRYRVRVEDGENGMKLEFRSTKEGDG